MNTLTWEVFVSIGLQIINRNEYDIISQIFEYITCSQFTLWFSEFTSELSYTKTQMWDWYQQRHTKSQCGSIMLLMTLFVPIDNRKNTIQYLVVNTEINSIS